MFSPLDVPSWTVLLEVLLAEVFTSAELNSAAPVTMSAPEWMTAEVPGGTGAPFSRLLIVDCDGA